MNNQILLDEIQRWQTQIQADNRLYELALFKIFIKFEKYVSDLFIYYCTGNPGNNGYVPDRKLLFESEEHLNAVLKNNNSYIDYLDRIWNISRFIFVDGKDPFQILYASDFNSYYSTIKYIRNYIAHESFESKMKYMKAINSTSVFIEPNDYLSKVSKKKNITNYSMFIEQIESKSILLLDPQKYF